MISETDIKISTEFTGDEWVAMCGDFEGHGKTEEEAVYQLKLGMYYYRFEE